VSEEILPIRDRLDLPRWLCEKGLVGYGAEVGVLSGEYSAHLLEYWPGTLYCVDPWIQQPNEIYCDGCNSVRMDRVMAKALAAVEKFGERAKIMREYSPAVSDKFADGSLSFVYLDGNHAYDHVKFELPSWLAKITPGGLLCGHDFYNRHTDFHECGVEQAVTEFCAQRGLKFYTTECTSWWVEV